MKKILLATVLLGFAFAFTNAQNPAVVSTKQHPAKVADPAVSKPAPKVAPATVRNGKPVTTQQGKHGKKTKRTIMENKDAAKPTAPGTDNKK
ncbi:MAG: hypothetical protein ABI763_03145 [Bacteroidota bacterium]